MPCAPPPDAEGEVSPKCIPAELGASVLKALVERNQVPGDDYDDVVFGCVDTIGPLAGDIARTCWLTAALPLHVPGVTIDRQCGSSQQAVHFAAQAVMSGTMDVVVAGGVQAMSQIPISAAMLAGQEYGFGDPFTGSSAWVERFGDGLVTQFNSAQMIADKWGLSREDLERFALESNERAFRAIDEGRFEREIIAVNGVNMDETPRRGTSLEAMAELKPLQEGGKITAAVSSQTCDAASAMLICSEQAVQRYDLSPRARVHHMSVLADDPIWMLTAPMPATRKAMQKTGMRIEDIDLVEINEAFAPVVMAWLADYRLRSCQDQCKRRCHCPRSSPGRDGNQAHDHPLARTRAHGWPLRPSNHVRGRRTGQCHHHREALKDE